MTRKEVTSTKRFWRPQNPNAGAKQGGCHCGEIALDPVLPQGEETSSGLRNRNLEDQGVPMPAHLWLFQESLRPELSVMSGVREPHRGMRTGWGWGHCGLEGAGALARDRRRLREPRWRWPSATWVHVLPLETHSSLWASWEMRQGFESLCGLQLERGQAAEVLE